ncbi:MAG: hypothetical protein ABIS50_05660 [Luteolibacter sp.]|uniref:hypothetical protein n=1 Tax=Luteolibacter sp. TaxID=1962973 RepID=UPI00326747EA
MKLHSKLTTISSVAALAMSPMVLLAGPKADPAVCVAPVDAVPAGDEVTIEPVKDAGGKADDNKGSDDVIVTDEKSDDVVVDDKPGDVKDGDTAVEVTETAEDGGTVPIDWVKRGGGDNPDVMFYNMAGGEAPVFKGETAGKELGQDEKATDIEAHDAPVVPQINREKKVPVALIKKGRVFLR